MLLDRCLYSNFVNNIIIWRFFQYLNLGCPDTPFLASYRCRTPERVRLAGFRCPASVLFFSFLFSFLRHALMRLRHVWHASSEEKKKENFCIFRVIPTIPANFGQNENFVWYKILTEKKKKKSKSKSYLLLLGFVLFFLLIFFLISVSSSSSSSSSSFGFGLPPDYLFFFFFICVSWLSSTCV